MFVGGEVMNFRILSLKEEKMLSNEELLAYYKNLREYIKNRELTNTTVGATTVAPMLKDVTNFIAHWLTKVLCLNKDVEIISDGQEKIPDGAVLFAHTHQGLLDNFAWIPETPQHCIIFHSEKVKKFLKVMQLNTGLILVNKDDKVSRRNAKFDTIKLLSEGHSVAFFPESAYLLSPNKLHLPMNYGFLDIARKAVVPVIPVVSEFFYDTSNDKGKIEKVRISFCKPIYVKEDDDLSLKLQEYEEVISTREFELLMENGVFKRSDISNWDYINYLKANLRVLKLGGIDIDVERKNLWNSGDEFYKFHHINDVPFDDEGNLLETEEVKKLEKINERNNIYWNYISYLKTSLKDLDLSESDIVDIVRKDLCNMEDDDCKIQLLEAEKVKKLIKVNKKNNI